MEGAAGSPPGDGLRSRVRIGDQERDRLLVLLREHYAAGRLSLDEVRRRTEIVLTAGYADEADLALAELPASYPVRDQPGGAASGRRRPLLGRRGHAETARPDPGWVPTPERFRDPSSGTIMRVWTDPADGSRHYIPDDPAT